MTESKIAETFILPSHGKIYEEDVNPEVILSSMTTKHEMLRLSANEDSQKLMADIIDDCIQSDVGISAYDMCLPDYQFLMYRLREVTFGNDYEMTGICPFCGSRNNIQVDLDELKVKEFTDDIAEYTHIHLPKSDVELDLTMQTPRLLDTVTKRVKQAKRRMNNRENPDILYVMLTSIVKKDGKDFDSITGEMWLRDLPLSDANVIIKAIDRLNSSFGLDLSVYHTCENCGEEIIVPFRVNETFFRPPVF